MTSRAEPTAVPQPVLLVVDDQPSNIAILYEIFKHECEVCMATSGAGALAFCQKRKPDLILLDIVMPDMLGFEVCAILKADPATSAIPIIFVTGNNDPINEAHALDQGGADYISKPFHATVVKARVRLHLLLRAQAQALSRLALTDGLTGLANRRSFDDRLEVEWRRCTRNGSRLSLLMIDVDHFKAYNDSYGHQAGDTCLQTIAAILTHAFTRPYDMSARYGGEEFACILPETGYAGALEKAEKLISSMTASAIPHRGAPTGTLSLSVGLASMKPAPSSQARSLLHLADEQLYAAKMAGRGRVCTTGEL